MPRLAPQEAPAAQAPAQYTSATVPPDFDYKVGSLVYEVFGSAVKYKDQCWPSFLLLVQSVARSHLDQDVETLVTALELTLEGAKGEDVNE